MYVSLGLFHLYRKECFSPAKTNALFTKHQQLLKLKTKIKNRTPNYNSISYWLRFIIKTFNQENLKN